MEKETWSSPRFKLRENILNAVNELGFEHLTPVQAACIPLLSSYKDVAAEAVTGSGKTLAFVIPVLEILQRREEKLKKREIGALIITPTQELAIQIDEVVRHFLKFIPQFSQMLLIGGTNPFVDVNNFLEKGGNIVVATPGRLEDLFNRKDEGFNLAASVKALEVLILDEADRLLEMGFKNSVNTILSFLPKQRRTGLFSATQTKEVEALIRAGLRNPVVVCVKENDATDHVHKTPAALKNFYTICEADKKLNTLIAFLRERTDEKIIVFFSTCACVDYFSIALQEFVKKSNVLSIHSKMKTKRHKIFQQFRQLDSGILICTDVMARGIDIPEIHWVVQYDPPSSASAFVHRCGRTARIGREGNALLMLMPKEDAYIEFLSINQKVALEELQLPDIQIDILPKLQKMATKDRAMFDKGNRAFVSYVQAYAKHECSLIFQVKDLSFPQLATGFALLRFPRMPELKGKSFPDFRPFAMDINSIPYKDKQREKLRQSKLEIYRSTGQWPLSKKQQPHQKSVPWSRTKEKRQLKTESRKLRKLKLKRKRSVDAADMNDLSTDINLMKKFKKGKMSKEAFDKEFAEIDANVD